MPTIDIVAGAAPDAAKVFVPLWLELLAVIVGGVSGGMAASSHKLDIVGAVGIAIVTGLGGGLVRDMALQVGDVYILENNFAIPLTIASGLVAYYFIGIFSRLEFIVEWIDILGVGLYTATGADKAIFYDHSVTVAIFFGVLTGVGGGMLRDIMLGEVPKIFRGGTNLYAVCSFVGAVVYCTCVYTGLEKVIAAYLCIGVVMVLRRLSLHFGIVTSEPVDLSPHVIEAGKRAVQRRVESGADPANKKAGRHLR